MKIGLFDSGLGGLIVTQSLIKALPQYDYVYLGDTARVPYGNRSQEVIYEFTRSGVEYLFEHGCQLVILACNTASAEALRRIQREFLPQHYPDRRVLGVLIPAAEAVVAQGGRRVGVIATRGTVESGAYVQEIHKLDSKITVVQQPTPLLVPLVENNALKYVEPILRDYLAPLLNAQIDTLVLGCTHYPMFRPLLQQILGDTVKIIGQDEVLPEKLTDYLAQHPELERKLTKGGVYTFFTTDLAPSTSEVAEQLFGKKIALQKVAF